MKDGETHMKEKDNRQDTQGDMTLVPPLYHNFEDICGGVYEQTRSHTPTHRDICENMRGWWGQNDKAADKREGRRQKTRQQTNCGRKAKTREQPSAQTNGQTRVQTTPRKHKTQTRKHKTHTRKHGQAIEACTQKRQCCREKAKETR